VRPSDVASSPVTDTGPALARGTALGRFVVLGLVGRGAMGEVYGAYDPDLDRKIAIKLLRARADRTGDTPERRARLMREAQATAKISHPNVVVVYDAGTFGDRVFIAMEFVEGCTLRYWLQEKDRTWQEILEAFLAAGRGLAAAHDKEFVHRDFKPDNVMVAHGGQVRVMDFGLARLAGNGLAAGAADASAEARADEAVIRELAVESTFDPIATPVVGRPLSGGALASPTTTQAFRDKITVTGALLGTPAYMSPEQFMSRPADARSDQFSFCVALHEAIYGARPFGGRTIEELASNVVAGRPAVPPRSSRVPSWVRRVLERGLSVDPAARYPTMVALLGELDKAAGAGRHGFASGAAAKLAGVWEAPVTGHAVETTEKEAMRQAFLATGKAYAAAAFSSASAVLDRYAQRWTELYVEVCEATHVRGEQSSEILDLRMACLNEGLDDLKALCRLFREPTAAVVENAVKAAHTLGTLERCQDIKLLRAVVRPPEDAATRAAVDELRARLVDVRALGRVGKLTEGFAAALSVVEAARDLGYGPMLAETLLVQGRFQFESGESDTALLAFEEAFSAAELARHEEVAVEAATFVLVIAGYLQSRFDVAEVWCRYAETLLRRMGGHDLLWGWFYNNRAVVRETQGRLAEAVEDGRRAIAAKEKVLGPNTPDLAFSIANLANHLAHGGDFEAALRTNERAVEILRASIGPDHPRTAVVIANHGQFLCRLARFDEARAAAESALAVLERETDPEGFLVTFPLRTLGLCDLGVERFGAALARFERAAAIRDAIEKAPLRLAEIHFPLARALLGAGGDRARAIALARRARREYERASMTPVVARELVEVDRWLSTHASPPSVKRTGRRTRPPARRARRPA
jgi:tRNA A-37 threonylcarbamoyl transferase component Bud32/tetratricopeptide (TPR) repeat protein